VNRASMASSDTELSMAQPSKYHMDLFISRPLDSKMQFPFWGEEDGGGGGGTVSTRVLKVLGIQGIIGATQVLGILGILDTGVARVRGSGNFLPSP